MSRTAECRHCGQVRKMRNKRLCYPCWETPGLKECYDSESPLGRRGEPPCSPEELRKRIAAVQEERRLSSSWGQEDETPEEERKRREAMK